VAGRALPARAPGAGTATLPSLLWEEARLAQGQLGPGADHVPGRSSLVWWSSAFCVQLSTRYCGEHVLLYLIYRIKSWAMVASFIILPSKAAVLGITSTSQCKTQR